MLLCLHRSIMSHLKARNNSVWGSHRLRCQPRRRRQVWHQRWISGNVNYICLCKKVNKREPILALKPRGDVTRNQKQGYQWPPKRHASTKNFKKKKKRILIIKKLARKKMYSILVHPYPSNLCDRIYGGAKKCILE